MVLSSLLHRLASRHLREGKAGQVLATLGVGRREEGGGRREEGGGRREEGGGRREEGGERREGGREGGSHQ